MLDIIIGGKELKALIEKVQATMGKLQSLDWVVLKADDGKISANTTNKVSWLEVTEKSGTVVSFGEIAIDKEDLKVITKMVGDVRITGTDKGIIVKNGKKSISMGTYDLELYPVIGKDEYEEKLTCTESDLLDALTNLSVYCDKDKNDMRLHAININLTDRRYEALDGHRIGMKKIAEENITCPNGSLMLRLEAFSELKKVLNKKSKRLLSISEGEKYILISGDDFTYYTEKINGEYFKINKMVKFDYDFSFLVSAAEAMDHFKYYADNVAKESPVLLKIEDDKVITYGRNSRFETADELEIDKLYGKKITIGFNPAFLVDAFRMADEEEVTVKGAKANAPILIEADNYSFLVLPVNIKTIPDSMEKYLNSVNVA